MRWLRAWTVMVWALALCWLVMLGFGIRFRMLDMGVSSVYVQSGDPYPTLREARPYGPLGDSALRPGDTLIEVNGKDLAGAGPMGFFKRAAAPMVEPGVPIVFERGGIRAETHLPLVSSRLFQSALLLSLTLGASALLLGLRAKRTPAVLWGVPAFLILAIEMSGHPSAAYPFSAVLAPIWLLAVALQAPLLICTVTHFPDQDAPELRWVRVLSWVAVVRAPLGASAAYGLLMSPVRYALPLITIAGGLTVAALIALLTRNYLRADVIGRRQLRWTVLGLWLAAIPVSFALILVLDDAKHIPLLFDSLAAFAVVPICLGISVLRYNWFDVDRLLSATASYNLLGVVLVGAGLVLAPRVGQAASSLAGIDPVTGQMLTAFLLAAVVIPAHRRLRPRIERIFFPERHAIDEGARQLLGALREVDQPRELSEVLGTRLHLLFRAESLAIYAPQESDWGVVFARGRTVPPAVDSAAALLPALAKRARPLALDDAEGKALSPIDRALLETLETQVLLPVTDGETLALLVCLGPKGSGDVYTSTDLSLLEAVANTASSKLRSFDHERRLHESKEMQESLRRYVPGAVAQQLTSGRDLTPRECEVSVLFVDIRGYTAWSEERVAADVFSTVNRYTEIVSTIVTQFGGSVVEFNGDGMMAVFGAPEAIPNKERAAVFAARELCSAVPQLDDAGNLSVGVGVATGPAFVGAIRAVDRLIWSAIGNTTNLAARLQSLTREYDAGVVIDEATWQAAASAAGDFARLDEVAVRGRRARMTLFALSQPES